MSTPFVSTHLTPIAGMDSWPRPDAQAAPGPRITENLEVQVLDRAGDWAKVVFSNGWSAWVDGRLLLPIRAHGGGAGSQANASPFDLSALLADRPKGVAVGGALLVALSSVLPWARSGGGPTINSFRLSAVWLVGAKPSSRSGIKIGLLLLLLSIATVVVIVRGSDKRVELSLGIASIAVPALYLVQLQRAISGEPGLSITDSAGFGIPVAIAGGVLVLVAPRLGQRRG